MAKISPKRASKDVRKEAFLKHFEQHGVIGVACKAIGVSRSTISNWRKECEVFEAAYKEAYENAVDLAEYELRQRAIDGLQEPVVHKGELIYRRDPFTGNYILDDYGNPIPLTIPRKSDRLLEIYTRSHRPMYKERSEVALTGADGAAVQQEIVFRFIDSDGDGKRLKDTNDDEAV